MSAIESDLLMSQMERCNGGTGAGPLTEDESKETWKSAWQQLIDYKLIEWGRNPAVIEDEGIETPDTATIQRAIKLAKSFRDVPIPPPSSVVPDGDGGIVFERRGDGISEVVHVWDDGTQEYLRFEDSRLVMRFSL